MKLTKKILSKHWNGRGLPVRPSLIAQSMGLKVIQTDIDYSCKYDADEKIIQVPNNNQVIRNRFALAHALGHHVLNHGTKTDIIQNFKYPIDDKEEHEANMFAIRLLTPKDFVDSMLHVCHIFDISRLALLFRVSGATMRFRLRELGYEVNYRGA